MKILKRLPMIIFCAFIGIMLLLFILLPKEDYSPSEKRYLADTPQFTFQSFFSGEFGEEFEEYLSDHTAFRKFFVGLNSYYDYLTNNNGKNGYYLCADGYIVTDPTTTEKLMPNIEMLNDFYDISKKDTTLIIAPSTGYICDDILPKNHLPYRDDECFEIIHENLNENIDFVDLRDTFKQEYQNGSQLYYKTDHHWTSTGAYTAYRKLCENLSLTPTDRSSYTVTSIDDFYGTTYSSSGYWLVQPDVLEVWDSQNNASVSITDSGKTVEQNSCFFYGNLEGDDQYTVFLDGNHPYTKIVNDKAENGDRVLIIKDSFAHCLTPFLSDNYKEITMIDLRYYKEQVSTLIENENIDRVIYIYSLDNFATDTNLAWLE